VHRRARQPASSSARLRAGESLTGSNMSA